MTLKQQHYPFWSRALLRTVEALGMLAAAEGIGEEGIAVYGADVDEPAGTLRKGSFGPLLHAELPPGLLPTPCNDLRLFIDAEHAWAITDLWIAVQWRASS
jgi:hypothetical protein